MPGVPCFQYHQCFSPPDFSDDDAVRPHPQAAAEQIGHPNVARVAALLHSASTIIVATPIYNYDATGALKNLIELTGDAWENKVVGFLCAAAGQSSYMSIMALANSLMLDFRSLIVPRFVYATGNAFTDQRISDPKVSERVAELARAAAKLDRQLQAA